MPLTLENLLHTFTHTNTDTHTQLKIEEETKRFSKMVLKVISWHHEMLGLREVIVPPTISQ